jgi:alkyl hydroperoxide reductase subunit AhpF|tara:strand:- start:485 stop:736 length:252 start_codon:yes stop_codon:yes gene_type:complete
MGIKRKRARLQRYLENKMRESVTNVELKTDEITTKMDTLLTDVAEVKTTVKATTKTTTTKKTTTKATTKKKAVAKKTTTATKK